MLLRPQLVGRTFYLFTVLSNDGLNCRVGDIWDRQMHNDNNCEILSCRKPLGFLQSQHEKDHKVQRHFESFSRLQVKELSVNLKQAFFFLHTVVFKLNLRCVVAGECANYKTASPTQYLFISQLIKIYLKKILKTLETKQFLYKSIFLIFQKLVDDVLQNSIRLEIQTTEILNWTDKRLEHWRAESCG